MAGRGRLCFVGVGSNVGDRFAHVCGAWRAVQEAVGPIVATSHLYDTAPQHVVDQPRFLNGVFVARTTLGPRAVLEALQGVEAGLGRVARYRHGPREVDLDVLFYGGGRVDEDDLVVPHPRVNEREFVLRPLADAAARLPAPPRGGGVVDDDDDGRCLSRVAAAVALLAPTPTVARVHGAFGRVWAFGDRTRVMGIINATPDSFSDGGRALGVDAALFRAEALARGGADVLDVGGESTRPGAAPPPLDEELRRVLPVIEALAKAFPEIPVSADTRRSAVAVAAAAAGAAATNDVSAGAHDPAMLAALAADGGAGGVLLMHARGTPETMGTLADYGDVAAEAAAELGARVAAAAAAGVCPWRIGVDPGLGFAKGTAANVALLRRLPDFKRKLGDLPLLLGPSRKRFLGDLAGEPLAENRDAATAACCAAAAPTADVVRVHDAAGVAAALRVADAVRR